jgi:hypothetical protein
MSQLLKFKCKPCALEIHSTRVHDLHPGLFYPLLFHYLIIFLQQCVALDCFLVGVSTSFSGHVFLDTSLGV